ncbi:hypothetical protein OAF47_00245 [bacterium]|nr:hypothetical protein [bacterium]
MDIDGTRVPDIGIANSQFNISSIRQRGTPLSNQTPPTCPFIIQNGRGLVEVKFPAFSHPRHILILRFAIISNQQAIAILSVAKTNLGTYGLQAKKTHGNHDKIVGRMPAKSLGSYPLHVLNRQIKAE